MTTPVPTGDEALRLLTDELWPELPDATNAHYEIVRAFVKAAKAREEMLHAELRCVKALAMENMQGLKDDLTALFQKGSVEITERAEKMEAQRDAAQAALKTAVEALRPFADSVGDLSESDGDDAIIAQNFIPGSDLVVATVEDLRRAASALAAIQSQEVK